MKDWLLAGEAWLVENENKIYIFQKQFKSEEDFLDWTKYFVWDLDLMSSVSDKTKKIKRASAYIGKKTSSKKAKKMGRPKKRKPTQCKKCGKTGHNARTCGR